MLVLFAHPALQKSRVNRALARAAEQVKGVTFHDLYERYPEMGINVEREQALLRENDIVVFQHPFYWYSTPAILKEWQDLVLEWGFAYGDGGTALRGKKLFNVLTAGGPEDAYCRQGFNHFTVRELLAPIEQTARLCGMEYLPPLVFHGSLRMSREDIAAACVQYARSLDALCADEVDFDELRKRRYLNDGPLPLLAGKGVEA